MADNTVLNAGGAVIEADDPLRDLPVGPNGWAHIRVEVRTTTYDENVNPNKGPGYIAVLANGAQYWGSSIAEAVGRAAEAEIWRQATIVGRLASKDLRVASDAAAAVEKLNREANEDSRR